MSRGAKLECGSSLGDASKPGGEGVAECRWHRRASERPEELFQATLRVFMEKGYRATRMEDVAKQAGVTKPLIYHYFKDKDDLLLKALEWKIRQSLADMRNEIVSVEDGVESRLRRLFEYSWVRWTSPELGRFHGLLMTEVRQESPDLFRKWVEASLMARWKMVEDILRDGLARGEVRADLDCVAAARFLISGGLQLVWLHLHTTLSEFAPCPEDSLRETAISTFLRGIRPGPENR